MFTFKEIVGVLLKQAGYMLFVGLSAVLHMYLVYGITPVSWAWWWALAVTGYVGVALWTVYVACFREP